MRRRHFVLNLLAAAVLASPAYAGKPPQYKFTSFDVPGGTYTQVGGVNNGGTILRAPAATHSDEDFDHVMDVNLRPTWVLSREIGRSMFEST